MPELLGRLQSALADRYRIEREIGAGGMATVYLAQDVRHDRRVALKVLRPELAAVIGAERFLAEIKLTANLQHPHILPLFDSGEADSLLFYVMPFVEGESLRDRLNREKQLPVDDAVRIATEVAGALDYAHRHGVVHRDIKPENILLHDGQALVADFGIALAASKASGARMTETGMSLGTPHYMSPEQAMGEREITARSDVYALGAVLYEMLTGEPPFTGPTAQAIVARVLTESPRPLAAAAAHHPAPRRGGGAHRAREAAGRPVRHRRGVRRGAQGQELRHARCRSRPAARRAPAGAGRRAAALARIGRLAALAPPSLATAAALWGWLRPTPAQPLTQFSLALRSAEALQPPLATGGRGSPSPRTAGGWCTAGPAEGGTRLWIRRLDQLDADAHRGHRGRHRARSSRPTAGGSGSSRTGTIVRIASLDGAPTVTLTDKANSTGGDWGDDGYVYFEVDSGLARMRADRRGRRAAVHDSRRTKDVGTEWPNVLPGGRRHALPAAARGPGPGDFDIMAMPLPHGTRTGAHPRRLRPLRADRAPAGGHGRREADRHPVRSRRSWS